MSRFMLLSLLIITAGCETLEKITSPVLPSFLSPIEIASPPRAHAQVRPNGDLLCQYRFQVRNHGPQLADSRIIWQTGVTTVYDASGAVVSRHTLGPNELSRIFGSSVRPGRSFVTSVISYAGPAPGFRFETEGIFNLVGIRTTYSARVSSTCGL